MPNPNFQDLVSLSGSTLQQKGPMLQIGTSSASTVTLGLSNSGGLLNLVAAPTGNGTVNFPTSGGTLLTNVNISGGTTSSNVSAVTFSNANNVTFGFDGSNVTASATVASSQGSINVSAGTTSSNVSAITFSNGSNVSFGFDGSNITASVATSLTNINVSAGTTSNNLSAVTFSNANGVTFGLNASTVTASVANGLASLSSWWPGPPVTSFSMGTNSLVLQPAIVEQNITATQILFLGSLTTGGGGGTISLSFGFYTNNASTLSLVSSVSTSYNITGAGQTGIQYISASVASWAFTPGVYVFGFIQTANSAVVLGTWFGTASGMSITTGIVGSLTKYILPGYSTSTTGAFPSSIAQSNTGYVRDARATSPLLQPTFTMMGT